MAIDNILSNENYISKDFQSIYTEYVNAVGKLNNKWLADGDGNESDPGVVLLKLLAAAEDKINYINDRGNLENYPDTVEIEANARSNFSPIYNMHWYRSGTGYVTIINDGDNEISLPDFLMLCSEDNSHIHTIIESVGNIQPGTAVQAKVIEGKIKTFSINGSDRITIDAFVDNKLYFDDYNIAENGIYVEPYGLEPGVDNQASSWKQVDNIYVKNWSPNLDDENYGRYFQFRIDPFTERPYLQFVEDLSSKIGDGLKVRYILSNGVEGNVSAGKITKVFTSDSELVVDSDNLIISNILPIGNGKNPETIESAKRNYFKAIDICNTLVTLRDYANAIYLADGLVSNCFVCDRTNDVQTSYRIVSGNGYNTYTEDDTLSAVNLKFYGLTYSDIDNGIDEDSTIAEQELYRAINYRESFRPINPGSPNNLLNIPENVSDYIRTIKSISHDFSSIRNDKKICMLKNYYKLNINLLFRQRLSEEQQNDIINKVKYALLNNLNAHNVNFGERITYQKVQQIIYSADNHILGASISGLDDTDFQTSAIYWSPYVNVPYYPVEAPARGTAGSYVASFVNNQAQLYQYQVDGNIGEAIGSPVSIFSGDARPHDIPNVPSPITSSNFAAYYAKDKSWINNYYLPTAPSGDVYVSTTKPVASSSDYDYVYHIELQLHEGTDPAEGTYIELNNKPTTPVEIDSDYQYFKINNKYWDIIYSNITENNVVNYHIWRYEYQPKLVYYKGSSDPDIMDVYGQFFEEPVSSEFIEANDGYDNNFHIGESSSLSGDFQTEIYAKNVLAGKSSVFESGFEFQPSISDTNAELSNNIAYVKPNLHLTISDEYQLGSSEYIQILSPQYDVIANYSFYVYMGYYNTSPTTTHLEIQANNNYKLGAGEYVIFYYRSSDSEPFTFVVYNQGNIICPSKTIQITTSDDRLRFQSSLVSSIPAGSDPTSYQGTANPYTQSQIENALVLLATLKSQDSCDVKRVIKREVQACSFITSDVQYDEDNLSATYKLKWNAIDGYNEYCRVLENGEQFTVYSLNGSQASIEAQLGAGDLLMCSGNVELQYINTQPYITIPDGVTLSYSRTEVQEISPESVINPIFQTQAVLASGVSSFIPTSSSTNYEEATWIEKCELKSSQVNSGYSRTGSHLYNDNISAGTTISGNKFTDIVNSVKRYVQSVDWTTSPSVTIQVKYHNQYNENGAIKDLETGGVVYFSLQFDVSSNEDALDLTGDFQLYTGTKIEYKAGNEQSYTIIDFSNDATIPQLIRSALSVDIDEHNSQRIFQVGTPNNLPYALETVEGFDSEGNSIFMAEPQGENTEKTISSNQSIQAIGGKQRLAQLSTIYAADITTENYTDPDDNTQIQYESQTDYIIFTFAADGQPHNLTVPNMVAGDGYIIYLSNSGLNGSYDLNHVSITANSEPLSNMYGTIDYDEGDNVKLKRGDLFTIDMNKSGVTQLQISAQTDAVGTPNISWRISKEISPYSYKSMPNNALAAILNKMAGLDQKNNYKIPDKDFPIDNPLAASSFLNQEHMYNKFTICQMNIADTEIK